MRIAVDTNVLLRAAINDDPTSGSKARDLIQHAELVVVTIASLCEFVWVALRTYKLPRAAIASAIGDLLSGKQVICDRAAAEAGLAMLMGGGDFADGIIAFEGRRQGGDIFATFDKKAARLIAETGGRVELL